MVFSLIEYLQIYTHLFLHWFEIVPFTTVSLKEVPFLPYFPLASDVCNARHDKRISN